MFSSLVALYKNEDGATAIEYGLIAVAAVATMISTVGSNLKTVSGKVASS
jgi:Flp pilus assembly pilin Flp